MRSKASLILGEAVVHDSLVAVEREAHRPAADVELACHPVELGVGDRSLPLPPLRALA
jgi:hypothetical protein